MVKALDDRESERGGEPTHLGDIDELLKILRQGAIGVERTPSGTFLHSLATDLHDGAVQELFAAELDIAELMSRPGLDPMAAEVARRIYQRIQRTTRHLRAVMRDMSLGERPGLHDVALEDAIQECIESYSLRHTITIDVDIRGPEVDVGVVQRETAVRLVREGLANVSKHAEASQVLVSIYRGDQWFTVDLDDDGRGDPVRISCAMARGGDDAFGLQSLADQAVIAGGRMWVSSAPTLGGVRLGVALPSRTPLTRMA